jgi:ABC-2 type transport system permease protein
LKEENNVRAVLSLAIKDLRLLLRDKGALFFSFGWPLIVACVFGFVFAGSDDGPSAIRVALVDEDVSEGSKALAGRLSTTEGLTVTPLGRDVAVDAVRRGRQVAAVVIPRGYGEAADRMFYGEPAKVQVLADPSRRAERAMLEGMLMGASMQGMERMFTDSAYSTRVVDEALSSLGKDAGPGVAGRAELERFLGALRGFVNSPAMQPGTGGEGGTGSAGHAGAGWKPLVIESSEVAVQRNGPRNAFMVTFPQGALWGVIGCAFGFALSLVIERTRGTMTRLLISPLSRAHVLAGKALACFACIVLAEILLFGVGRVFLDVVPVSTPLLVLGGVSLAIGFVGVMMFVSVLGRTEQTVGGLAWAILLPMSMFGGGMVPLFAMPGWMQSASHFSPVKWGILALEGALWRGFTFTEMLLPCSVLIAVGVAGFAVGAWVFTKRM